MVSSSVPPLVGGAGTAAGDEDCERFDASIGQFIASLKAAGCTINSKASAAPDIFLPPSYCARRGSSAAAIFEQAYGRYKARIPQNDFFSRCMKVGEKLFAMREYDAAKFLCFDRIRAAADLDIGLRARAAFGSARCSVEKAKYDDKNIKDPITLDRVVAALEDIQKAMEPIVGLPPDARHSRYHVIYNGTVLTYSVCSPLVALGHGERIAPFISYSIMCFESMLPLWATKYVAWRAKLYEVAMLCFETSADPAECAKAVHAATVLKRRVSELRDLEMEDAPVPEAILKILRDAEFVADSHKFRCAFALGEFGGLDAAAFVAKHLSSTRIEESSDESDAGMFADDREKLMAIIVAMRKSKGRLMPEHAALLSDAAVKIYTSSELLEKTWRVDDADGVVAIESPSEVDAIVSLERQAELATLFHEHQQNDAFRVVYCSLIHRHNGSSSIEMKQLEVAAQVHCLLMNSSVDFARPFVRKRPDDEDAEDGNGEGRDDIPAAEENQSNNEIENSVQEAEGDDADAVVPHLDLKAAEQLCATIDSVDVPIAFISNLASGLLSCTKGSARILMASKSDFMLDTALLLWRSYCVHMLDTIDGAEENHAQPPKALVELCIKALRAIHGTFTCVSFDDAVLAGTVALRLGKLLLDYEISARTAAQVLSAALKRVEDARAAHVAATVHGGSSQGGALKSMTASLDFVVGAARARECAPDTFPSAEERILSTIHADIALAYFRAEMALSADEGVLFRLCRRNLYYRALLHTLALNAKSSDTSHQLASFEKARAALEAAKEDEQAMIQRMSSAFECKSLGDKFDEESLPAPILIRRAATSMTFTADPKICAPGKIFAIYGKPAGAGTSVSLNNTEIKGTGHAVEVPSSGNAMIQFTVWGLLPGESYVFALAACDASFNTIGAIGKTSDPVGALLPLPLLSCWALLAKVLSKTISEKATVGLSGSRKRKVDALKAAASQAADTVFAHFAVEGPGTSLWRGNPLDVFVVNEDALAWAPRPVVQGLVETILVRRATSKRDAEPFDSAIRLEAEINGLHECQRLLIGLRAALSLDDAHLIIECAVEAFSCLPHS